MSQQPKADILHRLRHQPPVYGGPTQELREDAAREIERLRNELAARKSDKNFNYDPPLEGHCGQS